ncbi:protein PFC0760c-like isoform X2 [Ceratina calcarata]|uniref:Protein PFC0760c-like isoform X2 n=1 Tax=Ceratina calcarata TaxID=156304 RepID=A0AAJ7NCL8_9HYME|nr:protein PFC0760c-like isoform X2 [Ceratina calcarata]
MQHMNVVADMPPVPPRRKKKLRSKMPTIIINSPEETSIRFKAKRMAPPPPPPRRLKSNVVKTERKKKETKDKEEMIESSKVSEVCESKESENLNTNSTMNSMDKPLFVFETLLKKDSNKYPPLFFTLNDFQNVIVSEPSVEQCQEDPKESEEEDKNSIQENCNELFLDCSATSYQESSEKLNDLDDPEENSGQFSDISAYKSIEESLKEESFDDRSLQDSSNQESFKEEESSESLKSSIDDSFQEDSYKNTENTGFVQESIGKSLEESFSQFFEQSFANSLEDEENDLCFRVTTTNLPFGKCLDRFRESYEEANHFIFENYMDRSNRVNIRRSAGPMNYDSFNENFQESEEPSPVSRFTKVRFIIESPSSSTIDYSLDNNDLYDTNSYMNNDGEASNDSLQNIEPIEDEEQVFNHEPSILTDITTDKDMETVVDDSDDMQALVNEEIDWSYRINSVILTEITDDTDLDKVFDGGFNKNIDILTNTEDLVQKSLSHEKEIEDIKEDHTNCSSNENIDNKSMENVENDSEDCQEGSNRESFILEDVSKSFDEKIKQTVEQSLDKLEEDKESSTEPKNNNNKTEFESIENKIDIVEENTANINENSAIGGTIQNEELITTKEKSVNKNCNREHKRKFLESDSFRNRVTKCELEEKIESTPTSTEECFENRKRESISIPVNIRRNSFLENMLSDSSDIWRSCEVVTDDTKSLELCTKLISDEVDEKKLQESKIMNGFKSTTEELSRKATPSRRTVQVNEKSTGEVKCNVLNELLSNFDKIKLKPVSQDRECKKGVKTGKIIIIEENKVDNQKETVLNSEEGRNIENDQEIALNTDDGLKNIENAIVSNDTENAVLNDKNTEKKTILYSEKTDIIKGDLMNNLPSNSCNKSPNDLPNDLPNQDLKLISTGINKADNNDNSNNNREENDSAIISKLTSSGSHDCNGDCNYDNNGTATPIGILNKDQAVVTPGKVRKFVNYYEIRRETTINNDSTVRNSINSNTRVDKVVPGHQSVFSIRRSLELKETVKNEPPRSLKSLKEYNHYSEGSIDFMINRNKFSIDDNSNADLNSGMAYISIKKGETNVNDEETNNSETIVQAKSLNDDVNCQINTQIVVTNEFDQLIESRTCEIVDHKIGIDNDSDIITDNFREDHQANTQIKKKKSVKFENGFTIIGAKSPNKNVDEGDGKNKGKSNNIPKNKKKKKAPVKPTLKTSCLGMKIDLKRKDRTTEESSNVKEDRTEQKETTTLQIQSTTILNEEYYSVEERSNSPQTPKNEGKSVRKQFSKSKEFQLDSLSFKINEKERKKEEEIKERPQDAINQSAVEEERPRMGSNLSRHNSKGLNGRRTQSSGNLCDSKGKLNSMGKMLVPCSSGQRERYKLCGSLPNHLDDKINIEDDNLKENNNIMTDTLSGNLGGTLPNKKRSVGVHFMDHGSLDLVQHRSQDDLDENDPWRYHQSDLDLLKPRRASSTSNRRKTPNVDSVSTTDSFKKYKSPPRNFSETSNSLKYQRSSTLERTPKTFDMNLDFDLVGTIPKRKNEEKSEEKELPKEDENLSIQDSDLLMKIGHKPDCELVKHRQQLSNSSKDQGYASEKSPEEEHLPSLPGEGFPNITPESTFRVTLQKSSRGLGLSVSGGGTAGPVRVKRLFPQQPAALSNKLQPGDILLAANGIPLTGLTNYEALEVLRTTPSTVELVVCRLPGENGNVPPPVAPPPPPRRENLPLNPLPPLQIEPCGEFDIEMTKVGGSLGFTLRKTDSSALGHYVRALVREPALSDGRIKPGDKIVAVDGAPLSPMSHAEAVRLLRQCGPTVKLRLYRDMGQTPVAALSPTEDYPSKTCLRQEAVDMLCDLAVRKLSPGASTGSSCKQAATTSSNSPRKVRRLTTKTPDSEPDSLEQRVSLKTASTSNQSSSDFDQCSIRTQVTVNSQATTPGTDIIDPPLLYHVSDSSDSLKTPIPKKRPSFLNLSAPQDKPNYQFLSTSDANKKKQTKENATTEIEKNEEAENVEDENEGTKYLEEESEESECVEEDESNVTYNKVTKKEFKVIEPKEFIKEEESSEFPSEPASMPPLLNSANGVGFSYKNPAYQSANPAVGGSTGSNAAEGKGKHCSDQDIPGKVLGTEDPGGSKGLLKWKGVMFAPDDEGNKKEEKGNEEKKQEVDTTDSAKIKTDENLEQGTKVFMVELTRGWNSRLGFSLQSEGNRTVISVVHPDSVASKDGRLKQGDVLMMVNDETVEDMSTADIIDLLRKIRGSIGITVMRRNRRETS